MQFSVDHTRCRPLLLVFAFCLLQLTAVSQTIEAVHQKYRPLLTGVPKDTAYINLLLSYAYDLSDINIDTGMVFLQQVAQLSEEKKYTIGLGKSAISIGIAYADKGDYVTARSWYDKAERYFSNPENHLQLGKVYNNIGNLYYFQDQIDEAISWLLKSASSFEKAGALKFLSTVYDGIGNSFHSIDQHEKGLHYLEKAEDISRKERDTISLVRVLNNKSVIYNSMGKKRESLALKLIALKMADEQHVLTFRYMIRSNIADCYVELKQYDSAFYYLRQAEQLAAQAEAPYYLSKIYLCYANAYESINDLNKAETYFLKTIDIAGRIGSKVDLHRAYAHLTEIYSKQGQNTKSLAAFKHFKLYNDSLVDDNIRKSVNELETKYRTLQKDKEISDKQVAIEQQHAAIKKKDTLILFSVISFVALALITLLAWLGYRQKQQLQRHQLLMMQKEHQLLAAKAMMEGEEKERARIARNLHDGAGSFLSAAKLYLDSLGHQLIQLPSIPAYNETLTLLNEASSEIRQTAHNLMPVLLTEKGLYEAVKAFCAKVGNNSKLSVDFQSYGKPVRFNRNFELMVYRTVQELVNNVVKHAEASQAIVQLSFNEETFSISVEDNGKGFDSDKEIFEEEPGMGLNDLPDRMEAFNGKVDIDTSSDGTFVYILFEPNTLPII